MVCVAAIALGSSTYAWFVSNNKVDSDGTPDASRADCALCAMIAFRTGPDPETIFRLIKSSTLYREKWDRDDYRESTMQNARIAMDQEQYQKEFDELVERHSRVKQEYEEQAIAAEQDVGRVAQIDYFISTLEELNAPVTEFDEQLWISMVDHVVVHSKEDIRVVYLDGIEK